MSNIISIKNVSKLFGNDGIKGITFNITRGSFHVLIGSNGAGKTTLIRTLLHLYQEFDGEIKINGISTKNPAALKEITYISERAMFPSEFSARKYLEWAGILAGKNINGIKVMINDLSAKFKIKSILNKNPNKFSSGQKQKLLLIKILIEDGDLIILDEPTANLDPSARITFFEEIKKLHDAGRSIFVCSHNLEEVEERASWVTILDEGKVVYNNEHNGPSLVNLFQKHVLNNEEVVIDEYKNRG